MKSLAVAVGGCLLAITGCATSVVKRPGGSAGPPIPPGERLCVAMPADGRYGERAYAGSGQIVATRVVHALQARYAQVDLVTSSPDADGVAACRERGGRYLVVPALLHWEDRATGWSGLPDRIEVEVTVRDVGSDVPPRRFIFENRTNTFTSGFTEWGNAPPQKLLNDDFDRAVLELAAGGSP